MFDIETISSIISMLSSIKDNEDSRLVWRITDLIQETAGFTFVGLFLIDENREFVVMKSGSGLAGKKMVERNHRFYAYPKSSVRINTIGDAVYFNQIQLLDYSNSFASPDIGDSIWRLAFPLRVDNQTVGTLSVEGGEKITFISDGVLEFQRIADEVSRLLVKFNLI